MRARVCLTVLLAFSSTALSQWRMAEKSIVTRWAYHFVRGKVAF